MENESKQLNTVHEKDLDNLLSKIGVKEKFDAGQMNCKFCKEPVNKNNLYSVFPESASINMVCDKPVCVSALMEYVEEKKKSKTE